MKVEMEMPDGSVRKESVKFGDIIYIKLPEGTEAKVTVDSSKNLDMGNGPDKVFERKAMGRKGRRRLGY